MNKENIHYYEHLAEIYPTISAASSEIINLQSLLHLPKGTEHFLSDIHGEYDAFSHVLRNGSGAVRKKIDDVFGRTLSATDKTALATLIYYPQKKISLVKQTETDMESWYKTTLYRLIEVCKIVSSKYTRAKLRKALPEDYAYVIEELITEKQEVLNKEAYYESIVNTIVELGQTESFIVALAELIQRLVIDHLHILGDIYDRGPAPHKIMDELCDYHSVDVQWGNHDIVWMGAATGHLACIAAVIRTSIRYGNLDLLEEGYGINMLPLATLAMKVYENDPCDRFVQKDNNSNTTKIENEMVRKMHKAIAIIRFKLDGQLIQKYPEFGMEEQLRLSHIDYEKGTITIEGKKYKMEDMNLPTVDPNNPYELTEDEMEVMMRLKSSFRHCEKLQKHAKFLLKHGSLYRIYNDNLLYHGCVPMNKKGNFTKVKVFGQEYSGKALYDVLESHVRKAFFSKNKEERERGRDLIWYLWTAPNSPIYGRHKMATFERYFVEDKKVHHESKNDYYRIIDKPEIAKKILKEFGLESGRVHIINGHVPVRLKDGESPVKSKGKVIVIDGGFSKTYQSKTGIAGYTLTYNSYGLTLSAHEPFVSADEAVRKEMDIVSKFEVIEYSDSRVLVGDTDYGKKMQRRIGDLKELIQLYQSGELKERDSLRKRTGF
ncbi:MAG: fructose-1,6-bisphosphatase [Agathobacter sp.]|nr:fructose-1,6-bisphosphatase [Agathobacter sp.]